jgi:AcrR family transcriptional regulator
MTTPRPSAARERILDVASELFYEHGVRGVGVDTVIARSGVAKATLYHHFPSKDTLVLAYLGRTDTIWRGKLTECAEAAGPDPAAQLVGAFDALRMACGRDGYRGCAFINTAAESTPGSAVHTATVAHKQAVRDWLSGLARDAGVADPEGLAVALGILLDGGLAGTAMQGDPAIAVHAQHAARALVTAAVPPRDQSRPAGAVVPRG